jgi:hypothetical protein
MATSPTLHSKVAARLLFAAAILDLLFVYVVAKIVFPDVRPMLFALLPRDLQILAFPAVMVILLPLFWFITDVIAFGHSPGRLAMGLRVSNTGGDTLSVTPRMGRFLGKTAGLGLTGLRFDDLAHYDRMVKSVWCSPLSPVQPQEMRLAFVAGQYAGRSSSLTKVPGFQQTGLIRFGRDRDWAQVPFEDQSVSKRHCEVRVSNGSPQIRDLGSTSGTFVDGRQIPVQTWFTISGAQTVTIGHQKLRIG